RRDRRLLQPPKPCLRHSAHPRRATVRASWVARSAYVGNARMRVTLAAFRSKPFRLLFAGELVSLLGTAVAPVALAFAVLDLTGSATDLGYVLAAGWVPQIVFTLIGGVLGDRLPRNLVMV